MQIFDKLKAEKIHPSDLHNGGFQTTSGDGYLVNWPSLEPLPLPSMRKVVFGGNFKPTFWGYSFLAQVVFNFNLPAQL